MKIEEMIARKRELGLTYEKIAELSGLPLGTVQKVLGGYTKSPRYETIQALEKVLGYKQPENYMMRETEFSYGTVPLNNDHSLKAQGEYTLDDYYALPDDHRAELIDGVLYDMAAPSKVHQIITGFLFNKIWNHIDMRKGMCEVFVAPTDVRLDRDDHTMLQPDVIVKCESDDKELRCVEGAPDFVVEVLSPSTRKKDLFIKTRKYSEAGVRELWIVDPRDRRVIVYEFENNDVICMYTFEDEIPVGIYNGDLIIDFKSLRTYLNELYGEDW